MDNFGGSKVGAVFEQLFELSTAVAKTEVEATRHVSRGGKPSSGKSGSGLPGLRAYGPFGKRIPYIDPTNLAVEIN